MARQKGLIKLSGKTGDKIFYERNGKDLARQASESVKQTEASKKAAKDFGRSASAVALIRKTFAPLIKEHSDPLFIERLKRTAAKIIHTGPKELQGSLEFTDGDVALLKIVEFNKWSTVAGLFRCTPVITLEKTDSLKIKLPKTVMQHLFDHPEKAIKAQIEFMCGTFHFDLKKAGFVKMNNILIPLKEETFNGLQCVIPLQSAENSVIAVVMCVSFVVDHGVITYSRDRRFYAGRIIEVFNIKDGNVVEFKYPEKMTDQAITKSENLIAWEPLESESDR